MIDICDFAVGLSRQLYGRTMPSERPGHRLMETWHPLGVVGVVSRLQLPGRGLVVEHRGRPGLRRPGRLEALRAHPAHVAGLPRGAGPGDRRAAARPRRSRRCCSAVPRSVRPWSTTPASRCSAPPARPGWVAPSGRAWPSGSAARCSSSAATTPPSSSVSADLDLAVRGIVFSAAGTAGQRCTTMRRVIAHTSVVDELTDRLASAYDRLPIGNPMADGTLVGPLISRRGVRRDGGRDRRRPPARAASSWPAAAGPSRTRLPTPTTPGRRSSGWTTRPTWSARETFAPLLYVLPYDDFAQRDRRSTTPCPQGLSSSVFTSDQAEAELFLSRRGLRLRHRQRQHRHVRRGDRRRLRRREGDRRRSRVRLRRLARLHAPGDQHDQLLRRAAARPGGRLLGLTATRSTQSSSAAYLVR